MADEFEFKIRYWGVTGSMPRPLLPSQVLDKVAGSIGCLLEKNALPHATGRKVDIEEIRNLIVEHVPYWLRSTYGGNTTCIEIETTDALIIIDAGSGLRELGIDLTRRWNDPAYNGSREAHVLISHAHIDHTMGTPLFDPYYDARNQFKIWAAPIVIDSLNAVLSPEAALRETFIPMTFACMTGIKDLAVVESGAEVQIGDTQISTFALNHPGASLAYRLERNGRRVVFATDHEIIEAPDHELAEFARGAQLLYLDAQYLEDEYEGRESIESEVPGSKKGWGHSTAEAVVATAAAARAAMLHLGHHEPKRTDHGLHALETLARDAVALHGFPELEVQAAREGHVVLV